MHTSFDRIRQTLDVLGRAIRTQRDHRHLKELPDYLLKDIGLSRCDIAGSDGISHADETRHWGSWG